MPRIQITEVDNTIYSTTNTDSNIVYVPGITIKGPSEPKLVNSISEFVDLYGDKSLNNSSVNDNTMSSWEYAYNLLYAGYRVIFQRIVGSSVAASADLKISYTLNEETLVTGSLGRVQAKEVGTYGNNFSYSISNTHFKVYNGANIIDSYEFKSSLTSTNLSDMLDDLSKNSNFSSIKIVPNIPENYVIPDISNIDETAKVSLSSGTDIDYNTALGILESSTGTEILKEVTDKYIYDVKFITSGGFTASSVVSQNSTCRVSSNELYNNLLTIANKRQDCLVLFDVPYGQTESYKNVLNTVFNGLNNSNILSYAAAYAPWCYKNVLSGEYKWCPPSYVFLMTLMSSIKRGNPAWKCPAGVDRGSAEISDVEYSIGQLLSEKWQNSPDTCINPILNMRNYGYVIFGQRTLYHIEPTDKNYTSALREVSVRLTTIEIKKAIYDISLSLTFEGNSLHTWTEFVGRLTPILDDIKDNDGIGDYEVIMDSTLNSTEELVSNTVKGIVRITPIRAAENFDILFEINNANASEPVVSITESEGEI